MADVLPGFDAPQPKRERSMREQEHDAQVSYRKYHSTKAVPCADCVESRRGGRIPSGVRAATVIRKEGETQTYLCGRHAQQRRDDEELKAGRK